VEAPSIFNRGSSEWGYIGRYIFEGSKPGAAAAAVWLSHKVLPLDSTGYGRIIGDTARGARRLHRRISEPDWDPVRIVHLPPPDLNIVCFAASHPSLESITAVNEFVGRIHQAMSIADAGPDAMPDYFVTRTNLRAEEYGRSIAPILSALGFSEADYVQAGG